MVYKIFLHVLLAGILIVPSICVSDTSERRGQGVTQRARGQYNPLGVRIGGFMLSPRLAIKGGYDDNVYKRDGRSRKDGKYSKGDSKKCVIDKGDKSYDKGGSDCEIRGDNLKQHDYILHINPSLALKSNWNRHAVAISASGDITYHDKYKDEDWQDFRVNAKGRYDILKKSFVNAGINFAGQHEGRGTPDSTNELKEVTQFHVLSGGIGGQHQINRMRIALNNDSTYTYYKDNEQRNGTSINNSDRDRIQNRTTLTLGYKINERYEGFVRGSYNFREYDDKIDDIGIDRSSYGYQISTGINVELGNKLEGDVFAGYRSQKYKSRSVGGISGGFGLKWLPTGLTSVSANLSRTVQETTLSRYSGSFKTKISLRVDHELMRNVLLNARAGYSNNAYEGNGNNNNNNDSKNRDSDTYSLGFGGKYLLTRNLYMMADYTWSKRNSNIAGRDYESNQVYITIVSQL